MPRTYSSIEKIRAELAWVNETPDPNKCGCRIVRCCEETGHKRGECSRPVATNSGRFDGSTSVRPAAITNGREVRQLGTWSLDRWPMSQRIRYWTNLQQQLSIVFSASGQYSFPSFCWQQQASIFLPVSVQIRPDSEDTLRELPEPANTNDIARAIIRRMSMASYSEIKLDHYQEFWSSLRGCPPL
jgi:hypothetical protein